LIRLNMSRAAEQGRLPSPEQAEYAVNSDNFLAYCLPTSPDIPPQFLSPHLELPFVEEDLGKIDEYMRRSEEAQEFMYIGDTRTADMEASLVHQRMIGNGQVTNFTSDSPVELGLTRYFDLQQQASVTSDVIDDEYSRYNQMMPDVYRLIEEGHFPQIHYHEHPEPVLFSDHDFKSIIQKGAYEDASVRPVRSIIVSLPDTTQVMAVATSWTPLLGHEEMEDFSQYWESRFHALDRQLGVAREGMQSDEWRDAIHAAYNRLHLEILSNMGVKSYISRDRRNFHAFN